jgi:putative intracellular protease/amidase
MAFLPLVYRPLRVQHQWMIETAPTTEILFFDGFDDLDAIAPFEILTAAGFPVRAVGFPDPEGVRRFTSAHGLRIEVEGGIGSAPELLVVPGGGWRDGTPVGVRAQSKGDLPAVLAARHSRGTVLASVCTGAMLLATAGLLRGRPAVTHQIALDDLARAGADVRREARVVDDGELVTSRGPAAGLDLALRLVERFRGSAAAAEAADRLEHERVGPVVVTAARAVA